jgi:hypothetical protein
MSRKTSAMRTSPPLTHAHAAVRARVGPMSGRPCGLTKGGKRTLAWTFSVDVEDPFLNVRDPDGLIQDARWFPVDEAVAVLRGCLTAHFQSPQWLSSADTSNQAHIGRTLNRRQTLLLRSRPVHGNCR